MTVASKFLSVYLFLFWHWVASSLRLLRLHRYFLQIIINFSLRHRLHFFTNIVIRLAFFYDSAFL